MESARFILSKSKLFEQYGKLEKLGHKISYSVKTNPVVAHILEENKDCMFSIHTEEELEYVKDKARVWFLADSWDDDDIKRLIGHGIRKFTVHNTNDLDKIINFLKGKDLKIDLLLRVKLREHTIFTGRYFVFGMDAKTINEKIHELRNNPNINKLGVHFHRKTQNVGEWSLKYELSNILEEDTLKEIDIVNMGGGIPIKYKNTSDNNLPHIFDEIRKLKEWLIGFGIETIIEPGRFLSGPPINLEAYVKNVFENNIVVNCSVYNASMDTLIDPLKLLVEGEAETGRRYVIKGNTPCSQDIFRYSVKLPEKKTGDKIVFLNAGAYNFCTDFCSLKKLETVIVD